MIIETPVVFMLESYLEMAKVNLIMGDDLYSSVLQYISSNHNIRVTAGRISEELGCSVSTVSHMFKRRSGSSISEYVEKLRLDEEKWLLKQSMLSVTEVSASLGFCNPAYFAHVFKNKFGVSPKEYKRLNK